MNGGEEELSIVNFQVISSTADRGDPVISWHKYKLVQKWNVKPLSNRSSVAGAEIRETAVFRWASHYSTSLHFPIERYVNDLYWS